MTPKIDINNCYRWCPAYVKPAGWPYDGGLEGICEIWGKPIGDLLLLDTPCPMLATYPSLPTDNLSDMGEERKKAGDKIKRKLKEGMLVTTTKEVDGFCGSPFRPGRIGIVSNPSSAKVTHRPYSRDPDERRVTSPIIKFYDEKRNFQDVCAPLYWQLRIVKLGELVWNITPDNGGL